MSWYLDENIEKFGSSETNQEHEDFQESNMMHGNQSVWWISWIDLTLPIYLKSYWISVDCNSDFVIFETRFRCVFVFFSYFYIFLFISAVNGRMYGNLLGLEMCSGDKVRWYTFGLGTEVDIHGVYFEGNTFSKQSTTRDTLNLFPHTTVAVDMKPDTPG